MTAIALTRHYQKLLSLSTRGKSLQRFTQQAQTVVTESGITTGLCTVFIRHTSASLIIQENADPDVLIDLENFLSKLVPEQAHYVHSTEGPDDMPAHIRSMLTHTSENIPVMHGRLALGTWQGLYLWEHRSHAHHREIVIHIVGS
jgi:secondary thiamine-phosphate synthase enzyme